MRMVMALVLIGCASPRPSRTPVAQRCTVRPTERGLFVDGERMSSEDAAAYCRQTDGAVVILEENPARTQWTSTRQALERDGVRVYVRGRTSDLPDLWRRARIRPTQERTLAPVEEPIEPQPVR